MTLSQVIQFIDHLVSFTLLIGGIIAFLFRTWISEAIKHRFAHAVNREVESHKHSLSRELEAYKISLMRDLEQFRADIDIRRTIALQTASAKLNALRELFAAFNTYTNAALAYPTLASNVRMPKGLQDLNEKTLEYRTAFRNAEVFLAPELQLEMVGLASDVSKLANQYTKKEDVLSGDSGEIKALLKRNNAVSENLRKEISGIGV